MRRVRGGLSCGEQHLDGRRRAGGARARKHWIRVERYWEGEFPDVRLKFRPVMCQQCDNAPCEPVCPTYASHHTADGLNAQVYNRCIGTRYCANACPHNVRFFDFFNPSWDKPLQLQLNPDVRCARSGHGKCTFCVQRIKAVRSRPRPKAAIEGRRDQASLRAVMCGEGARLRRSQRS
jgi:molybdopterin-containing oxidoreductase family iron-sulfur binding subunit